MYRIAVNRDDPNDTDLAERDWFMKAYATIPDWDTRDTYEVDKEFEETFNVKLEIDVVSIDRIKPIRAIIFPSEAEATLFMLRWI